MHRAVLATALVAVPVAAHAGSSSCPSARVCLYADNNFSSLLGYRSAGGGRVNISSASDNQMDSWENKTATNARWYHDPNGGGKCVTMSHNSEDANINFLDSDTASSWATDGSC